MNAKGTRFGNAANATQKGQRTSRNALHLANLKRIQPRCADHTAQLNCAADTAAGGVEYDHRGSAARDCIAESGQRFTVTEFPGDN